MPSSIKSSVAAAPSPVAVAPHSPCLLRPAARGSLLCFCHGEVVEMGGQYGWLKVYGEVNHPLADKRGGHIYLNKQDVVQGEQLTAGTTVTFYLYADKQGLGAEGCQVDSYASAVAQGGWQHQQQQQQQTRGGPPQLPQQAMYFVPCGFALVASPTTQSPTTTFMPGTPPTKGEPLIETVGELPSVGSANHGDGSCKRCAFFPKGRCQNGYDCAHCHFDHSARMRLRKRRQCRTYGKHKGMQDAVLPDQDETSSMHEGPCKDVEVLSAVDNDEVTDLQSIDTASDFCTKSPIKGQEPQEDDSPSEDDMVDVATRAPSSSPSDDESMPACQNASGQLQAGHKEFFVKEIPSESGSEGGSSHGCVTPPESPTLQSKSCATPPESPTLQSKSCGLALSPTSWSAQLRARRAGPDVNNKEVSTAEISRMARALLNKLTRERFESLCGQILALPFTTQEQLSVLSAEIFEKATTQNGFRSLYTELCVRLDGHLVEQNTAVGGKAFRKALVNECQATFERHLQPADPALFVGLTADECFEVEMKLKTRRLGNMRFIGELLVKRLLAQKLMPPIVLHLLHGDEAALESLIALLTVIAPVFEQGSSLYKAPLRDAFATLHRKKNEPGISNRLRCHLSDLLDARAQGWVARSA